MLEELQNEKTSDLDASSTLLTIPQVAERLACSTKTVRRRIRDGSLSSVKIGPSDHARRVSLAALADFITAQTRAGESS